MRVEVLGRLERRGRWSQDDEARIGEETLAPGAKVAEVARRNGLQRAWCSPGVGKLGRSNRFDRVLRRCRWCR
jgi:transposase-like protein